MVVIERFFGIAEALAPVEVETEDFLNEMEKESISNTPLGRVATIDDVAKIAVFLASSESDFHTGMSFILDGGSTMY